MNELINFLTSKEIIVVYMVAGVACFLCFLIYLIDKTYYKRTRKHNTKELNKLVEEVNRELEVLETALKDACEMLNSKGRVCVITFNSLEDRIVKRYFNSLTKEEQTSRYLPSLNKELEYVLVNKKVIIASNEELESNNRAKPAKLRIIERK